MLPPTGQRVPQCTWKLPLFAVHRDDILAPQRWPANATAGVRKACLCRPLPAPPGNFGCWFCGVSRDTLVQHSLVFPIVRCAVICLATGEGCSTRAVYEFERTALGWCRMVCLLPLRAVGVITPPAKWTHGAVLLASQRAKGYHSPAWRQPPGPPLHSCRAVPDSSAACTMLRPVK